MPIAINHSFSTYNIDFLYAICLRKMKIIFRMHLVPLLFGKKMKYLRFTWHFAENTVNFMTGMINY